ncbi:hypothetical protein PSE_3454 [Pseudovibrio sp. FO-BEG1]|nr:hypothetical protein PSE_3454 [Pseudovibrio sp. FO-BEG1]
MDHSGAGSFAFQLCMGVRAGRCDFEPLSTGIFYDC